jgi:GTP cyclohydrolase I
MSAVPRSAEEIYCMGTNVHALELTRSLHGVGKPDRAEVEAAVRTIIRWSGDNPERDGLIETPARVARALEEAFAGYGQDPAAVLRKSFDEIEGYDEMVVLRGVRFESRCEHHLAPIVGRAWVAYVPNGRVVGISKLARVVEIYARRLQLQERLTAQIANVIEQVLQPRGVGVLGQGDAPLHDRPRRPQARRGPCHQPHDRLLARSFRTASGISQHDCLSARR